MVLSVGDGGLLPEQETPHEASLDEVYQQFVANAPFREQRELIFQALRLHMAMVSSQIQSPRFWINGGFTTHKPWAAPDDVDVATVVSPAEYAKATSSDALQLLTLQGVSVARPTVPFVKRLQPFGGLVDSFFVPDIPDAIAFWHEWWSKVRGQDGNEVSGLRKGYVEVTP